MWASKKKSQCRQLIDRTLRLLADRFSPDCSWIQNHIANCPRCQRRIARLGRVELAISLLKSRPHSLELLMRANTQAIGVLKRSLRTTAKAEYLRNIRPEPNIFERISKYKHSLANCAACIVIAVLMKNSATYSAKSFENKGKEAIEQFYASRAGEDIASDIFSTNA